MLNLYCKHKTFSPIVKSIMENKDKKIRIELTAEEVQAMKDALEDKPAHTMSMPHHVKPFSSLIDKMEKYIEATGSLEESGDFPLRWFWERYREQEGMKEELDFNDGPNEDGIMMIFDR